MIAIVDYGSGNVAAISNIYKRLKIPHVITRNTVELENADRFILPGVGAFDTTMRYLKNSGIAAVLNEQVLIHKKNVLGICVGMQVLADSSEEGGLSGLGWIPGRVRKINADLPASRIKLPHMGWNSIQPKGGASLFNNVDVERGFYFLHNYYFDAAEKSHVAATVDYGGEMPCALAYANVYGMQFHPEKSHSNGVAVFQNFAEV